MHLAFPNGFAQQCIARALSGRGEGRAGQGMRMQARRGLPANDLHMRLTPKVTSKSRTRCLLAVCCLICHIDEVAEEGCWVLRSGAYFVFYAAKPALHPLCCI